MKQNVSSLYFVLLFSIVCALEILEVLSLTFFRFNLSSLFFLLMAVFQLFSLYGALYLLGRFLKTKSHYLIFYFFIGFVFVLFSLELIDIILVMIMDISVLDGLKIISEADFDNFLELLYLAEIGIFTWILIFLSLFLSPFVGIALYEALYLIEQRKVKGNPSRYILNGFIFSTVMFFITDISGCKNLSPLDFEVYKKTLPLKTTITKTKKNKIYLEKGFLNKTNNSANFSSQKLSITKKPNIYLFVAESLRSDFITEENAPNLTRFKNSYIHAKSSFASSNCTHTSWFSIFNSLYPFYWSYNTASKNKEGSLCLKILKDSGYNIHVYSSAQLRYYHLDETLFGKERALVTSYNLFPHYESYPACASDAKAIEKLICDLSTHSKDGNVYIIFLDSTHFNYSWPSDFKTPFEEYSEFSWKQRFALNPSDLKGVINRYKNSIFYVDSLFQKVLDQQKKNGTFDESIVVFCGDHGEEFKEEGKLFHASNLSQMQISVPIYYKLGNLRFSIPNTTHLDIFPTIFDYLDRSNLLLSRFDGESIFSKNHLTSSIVTKYNGGSTPYKFSFSEGGKKILCSFSNKKDIQASTHIKILTPINESELPFFTLKIFQHIYENKQ